MLLRNRPPDIDTAPVALARGFEHLDQGWVAVLRWLNANRLDYVVVGPVAHAIRGEVGARGPVAIVPAPYGRNFDRLAAALVAQRAGLRSDRALPGSGAERGGPVPIKLTADKLARGRRWLLRFSGYDLDVEGAGGRAAGARGSGGGPGAPGGRDAPDAPPRAPRYQELLYEAGRFELAPGLSVEVASPEDLEHFSHVRRTGVAPEFRVIRNAAPAEGSEGAASQDVSGAESDAEQPGARQTDSPAD